MTDYEKVLTWLEDDESRFIYQKRVEYMKTRNYNAIQEIIERYLPEVKDYPYQPDKPLELVNALRNKERIIVFGAGIKGKKMLKLLQEHGIPVDCVLDNNKENVGLELDGVQIVSPQECDFSDACCIITPRDKNTVNDIFEQIVRLGLAQGNIYKYNDYDPVIIPLEDKQYFDKDIIRLAENEVFIDGGVYNLGTSKLFAQKCAEAHVKNYKIYAFEPDSKSFEICRSKLDQFDGVDIQLFPYGLWSKPATLHFSNNGSESRITAEEADSHVNVVALDTFVKDDITFIKLDVEGAELETLKGAAETIKRCKPKLAISLYHKDEDLTEIPMFVKELVPEYRCYVRHYSNMTNETVLYAVI